MTPPLSHYFASKNPPPTRMAQMECAKRTDAVTAINVSVGNVSLPMHPAMQERMLHLADHNTFHNGIVQYTATVGTKEANDAFLNIIASSGCKTKWLYSQITDGWSQAMELVILGVSDAHDRPILLIDPAYANYLNFAARTSRDIVTITRTLQSDWLFSLPAISEIERLIQEKNPSAIIVIPYDNPTGQLFTRDMMIDLARLCVAHDMWYISDEAYRELYYTDSDAVSIRGITNEIVPGIESRRISLETTSKVWNACGLRIGALVTDNQEFHTKAVIENANSLCANTIGQHILGALAHVSHADLQSWYRKQRDYYGAILPKIAAEIREAIPWAIVSRADASIYLVVDVRDIVQPWWDTVAFSLFCAREWKVDIDGVAHTLLVAPMAGFYSVPNTFGITEKNPWQTQMRIACVETPERMALIPMLLKELLGQFEGKIV